MSDAYDVIVLGGDPNGLAAAARLAQRGRRVLVLERRAALGGAAASEELYPGFHFNTGWPDAGLLDAHATGVIVSVVSPTGDMLQVVLDASMVDGLPGGSAVASFAGAVV